MCRRPPCQKGLTRHVPPNRDQIFRILPTPFLLTRCRTFVTFLPSSNTKERCMKFLAITVTMAGVLIAGGCRHDYNPTPPAYYCQPACGCAPACTPACNPCAPSTTPYLQPTPTNIPAQPSPMLARRPAAPMLPSARAPGPIAAPALQPRPIPPHRAPMEPRAPIPAHPSAPVR